MDLLGSILNSMDKPPTADEKQKQIIKNNIKRKNDEIAELERFRQYALERLGRFVKDENRLFLQFQPLDKIYRTVLYDLVETAGLVAMSFGQDGHDRYVVVYKKEHLPSEDEILARRNGDDWNEETAKKYAQKRLDDEKQTKEIKEFKPQEFKPTSNYKDKYVHLIGQESAKEAARKTESNKQYGFVPSENKKDIRSIEQTMADIQAKKRLKLSHDKNDNANVVTNLNVQQDESKK